MKKYITLLCSLSPFPKERIQVWIIISVLLFLPVAWFADECSNSCQIADAPAPVLTEYFTNIQTLQSNILDVLSDAESDIWAEEPGEETTQVQAEWEDSLNAWKRLLQSMNSLLNFNDYYWSFDFKIALPITNEVPNEVKRDHRKLENVSKRLASILESASRRNTLWVKSGSICDDIANCDIGEVSMWQALTTAIKNNREIIRLFESSILDKAYLAENRNFILVSSDFEAQLQEYYNKDTLGVCSKCEGNSWSETSQKIKDISIKNSEYKAWVQKWKDAWALMRWGKPANNAAANNKVLSEYLGTQWISWGQADVVLDNLDRYGSGSISWSNPGLNSANYASASVENTIDTFSQTLSQQFEWREKVPIIELAQVNAKIKSSEDLALWIKSLYEDQLPFAQSQDVWSQQLQLRIIRMHASLLRSINELQKNVKVSQKLCDKQWAWDWKCSGY
jgi:hypothetical protein